MNRFKKNLRENRTIRHSMSEALRDAVGKEYNAIVAFIEEGQLIAAERGITRERWELFLMWILMHFQLVKDPEKDVHGKTSVQIAEDFGMTVDVLEEWVCGIEAMCLLSKQIEK
jgi:hypothetical protein